MEKRAWAHLHLPRLRSGETPNVISLKVPGERIGYVSAVELLDVEFRVSAAGRLRCIREGVRNVHAWVVGVTIRTETGRPSGWTLDAEVWRKAVYDPWKGGAFVDTETLEPVHTALEAILVGKDVWYRPFAHQVVEVAA